MLSWRRSIVPMISAVLLGVAGCTYDAKTIDQSNTLLFDVDAVRSMEPQGPKFNQGLREGYLDYSDIMYSKPDPDYFHFVFKAVASAKGEDVGPDTLDSRSIPDEDVEELGASRARLLSALQQSGRRKAPFEAAGAQTAFDCWLERVEDGGPADDIERCRGRFAEAIAEVERALVTTQQEAYLLFFAWDQSLLSPVAVSVVDQVSSDYASGRPVRVIVAGHTDRSGSESYNLDLSERRARAVARALTDRGVPAEALDLQRFGEMQPRVPTDDGVREPQNRRVEIVFG